MWTWHKKNPNKPLDADRAACPGRSPKDSSRGRWLFIRHRQAGRTLPHRIGISGRERRLAPVSRSIYRLYRGAQRTCVSWVTLELIRAPALRWQPAQWGLTDALRKRTDPSWSYFMPQPTHATPREASNPKSDFSLCAVFPNDCCTSTPSISLGRMWKKEKNKNADPPTKTMSPFSFCCIFPEDAEPCPAYGSNRQYDLLWLVLFLDGVLQQAQLRTWSNLGVDADRWIATSSSKKP